MSRFTFKLPDIGEGISEAEIVAWHVAVGDRVEEDQQIADMMTDKATVEMESPVAGTIVELAGDVGDQISIGSMLVEIETGTAVAPSRQADQQAGDTEQDDGGSVSAEPRRAGARQEREEDDGQDAARVATHADGQKSLGANADDKPVLASPAVRARARDLGIDLAQVKPAEGDRVRHADLDAFLRYGSNEGYHSPHVSRARADELVKVIGLRRRIAENMAAAKRNIPHFTYVEEIDVTALEAVRADLNSNRGDRPRLTVLPLLIAAICRTIPQFPMINASYDDEAGMVTRHGSVHLGMATQTDAGLMVPVIKDAQDKNVWQLTRAITHLAEAARSGKATSDELSGSTLTITSLGPLGGIATTPVINRPEVAIIGPNKIVERPVFDGDEIVRAKLMNLSISCDHRVVDGWDAASFVQALKKMLETPVLLFAD